MTHQRYATLVVDPPWHYATTLPGFARKDKDTGRWTVPRSRVPYQTMSIDEIAALPVGDMGLPDSHLYLWTTNTHIPHAFRIVEAWGYRYSTTLVWCKAARGYGGSPTYAIATEFCLFCRRGSLRAQGRSLRNWWQWPRQPHSRKPEAFMDIVEQVSPGPYLELFARRQRMGWAVMGGDVDGLDIRAALRAAIDSP